MESSQARVERGPGWTREKIRREKYLGIARDLFYKTDFDPDSPLVKDAIAKRERRLERNRNLVSTGAVNRFKGES